jgi:hypothetical protein
MIRETLKAFMRDYIEESRQRQEKRGDRFKYKPISPGPLFKKILGKGE